MSLAKPVHVPYKLGSFGLGCYKINPFHSIGFHSMSSCSTSYSISYTSRSSTRQLHTSPVLFDKRAELGQKILNKVPRFLKPYTVNFIRSPLKNLTSFLILHELSAVGPLVGLWYLFHKYNILIPLDLPSWAIEKGTRIIDDSLKSFDFKDYSLHDKFRLVTEGAYAFVIVKMLLPVRLMFSFALTPMFTRFVVDPLSRLFKRNKPDPIQNTPVDPTPEVKIKQVEKRRL